MDSSKNMINRLALVLKKTSHSTDVPEMIQWLTLIYELGHAEGMREGVEMMKVKTDDMAETVKSMAAAS